MLHAAGHSEGRAEGSEDADYDLNDGFPSFLFHFLSVLVVNSVFFTHGFHGFLSHTDFTDLTDLFHGFFESHGFF